MPDLVCGKFPIRTLEMSLQLVMTVGECSSVGGRGGCDGIERQFEHQGKNTSIYVNMISFT